MLNAMFMNPESSVAIMIKTCGCSLRDNYWNLLRHGSPGRIVQWVAHREGDAGMPNNIVPTLAVSWK